MDHSASHPQRLASWSQLLTVWGVLRYLVGREATLLISSISFSFMVSLFPFILLLLTAASYLEWRELRHSILDALDHFFPISQDFIVRNLDIYTGTIGPATLVSCLLLLWSGSALFFALEGGLDSAYRVSVPRRFALSQLLGGALTALFGVVVFAAILLMQALRELFQHWLLAGIFRPLFEWALSILLTLVLFGVLYYFLPNRRRPVGAIRGEAIYATAIWTLTHQLFKLLAPSWSLQKIYGPFYISMTLLLWAYASGCVLLSGTRLSTDGFFKRAVRRESEPSSETQLGAVGAAGSKGGDPSCLPATSLPEKSDQS